MTSEKVLSIEEKAEIESKKKLEEILGKEIPIQGESGDVLQEKIGNLIDPDRHIWFTNDTLLPIINEDGLNILVEATGAVFSEPVIIEKQSDYSYNNGQVWIEIEVSFPTTKEKNRDYGIANNLNCPSNIAKANMPIMALKRAKERAFLRSDTIGLKMYSDTEMAQNLTDQLKEQKEKINELEKEKNRLLKENINLRDRLNKNFIYARESAYVDGLKVWEQDDPNWLKEALKREDISLVEEYILKSRIRFLEREKKKENNEE